MNKICLFLGHNRFTGVNTWALTLVNELIKFNYEVDVIFEKIKDPNGNIIEITHGNFNNLLQNHNRKFRQKIFKKTWN